MCFFYLHCTNEINYVWPICWPFRLSIGVTVLMSLYWPGDELVAFPRFAPILVCFVKHVKDVGFLLRLMLFSGWTRLDFQSYNLIS